MAAICVYCASSTRIDRRHVELAAAVGTEIAARGHELVSGGGSVSSMGAVARAARAGGARTIGVIPRALAGLEVADADADELVVTPTMRDRKAELERRADAFLTLAGGLGTLEELLEIWVGRTLGFHHKPVVVLDPEGVFAPLRAQVDALRAAGFVRAAAYDAVRFCSGLDEAFEALTEGLAAPAALPAPPPDELLEAEP